MTSNIATPQWFRRELNKLSPEARKRLDEKVMLMDGLRRLGAPIVCNQALVDVVLRRTP